MFKKFVRWLIFGDAVPELPNRVTWRYFIKNGKPHKELVRRAS